MGYGTMAAQSGLPVVRGAVMGENEDRTDACRLAQPAASRTTH